MKKLILVGGASASGKSTFTRELNNCIENSLSYRRLQAFFDIAEFKNISKDEIFKSVSSKEADSWFFNICINNDVVISDIHYALQMKRNFKYNDKNVDIHQEYVPTISLNLISELLDAGVQIVAVYLNCPSQTLFTRAIDRKIKGERELRAVSIEDVELQNKYERYEWKNICDIDGVVALELNSEQFSPDELVEQFLKIINCTNGLSLNRKREK